MNFAFPAVLIFCLLLPGIVYRFSYARGFWSWANPTSLRSISDELAYSVIVAVGLHFLWLAFASLLGYPADYGTLLALLTGNFGSESRMLPTAIEAIRINRVPVALYFLSIYVGSAALGLTAHLLVRKLRLDHRFPLLRFENPWYYLLTGEVLAFDFELSRDELPDGVYLSAVIEQGEESFVYWGIVRDFMFNVSGELDRIVLISAHRRRLANDRERDLVSEGEPEIVGAAATPIDERYYEIRGDYLIVQYAHIRTLNLDYFWIQPVETTLEHAVRTIRPANDVEAGEKNATERSMTTRHSGLAAILVCLIACESSDNTRRAGTESTVDTVVFRPVVTIGRDAGRDDVLARSFSGFRSTGSIIIANGAPPEIRVYDIAGALIRRIGREGAGPGEFRQLTWIAPWEGDSIAALDARASRITVFSATGAYVRTLALDALEYGGAEWIGTNGDNLLIGMSHRVDPRQLPVGGFARDSFALAFIDRVDGSVLGTRNSSVRIGGRWWRREALADAVRISMVESGPHPLVAASDGALLVSASDSPNVLRWNGQHWDTIQVHKPVSQVANRPAPSRHVQLAVSHDGEIWLADTLRAVDGSRQWSVLDRDGVLRAVTRLPARLTIWQVGHGWVLGRLLGEDDVEYVQLLERRSTAEAH